MNTFLQIKDWKTIRDDGIIKQDLGYSCGAASIATLLNRQYGQQVTEEEVLALLKKVAKKEGELLLPICSRFCQNWDFVHRDMPCHLRN